MTKLAEELRARLAKFVETAEAVARIAPNDEAPTLVVDQANQLLTELRIALEGGISVELQEFPNPSTWATLWVVMAQVEGGLPREKSITREELEKLPDPASTPNQFRAYGGSG